MIRPGTDLALNYALMHVILKERLYDVAYVDRWVQGVPELQDFVRPYTPQWAEQETGIPAEEIVSLAREVSQDKPSVVFHMGYRGASHTNEIYLRRSILMLECPDGKHRSQGRILFQEGARRSGSQSGPQSSPNRSFPKLRRPASTRWGPRNFPCPIPNHGVPQMLPRCHLERGPLSDQSFHCQPL